MSAATKAACAANAWEGISGRESHALFSFVKGGESADVGKRWEVIVETARRHRVVPLLASSVNGASLPEPVRRRLNELVKKALEQTKRAYRGFAAIVEEARKRNLPLLVFKGPVLSEALYSPAHLRSFVDLDILARREDLEKAEQLFVDLGYEMPRLRSADLLWMVGKRASPDAEEHLPGDETRRLWLAHHFHLPFEPLDPSQGVKVDLHWDFFREKTLRLPIGEFWQRAIVKEVAGRPVLTFSPADSLLYLCVHTSTDGYHRLRLIKLIDVVRAADKMAEGEWSELAERARKYGVEEIVFFALWVSYRALGRQLPRAAEEMRTRPGDLRRGLLAPLLTEKSLLRCNSPCAHAVWDWELGEPGLPLLGRMFRAAARQWAQKILG